MNNLLHNLRIAVKSSNCLGPLADSNPSDPPARSGLLGSLAARVAHSEEGLDGILVTIGLCIIALLLCVVMKDSLEVFITTLMESMTQKAQEILSGSAFITGGLL